MYDLHCCHDQLAISAWHLENMAYIWLSRGEKIRTKLLFEQELTSFSDHFHFTQHFFSQRFVFCVHIPPTWIVSAKPLSIPELFMLIICHKWTIRGDCWCYMNSMFCAAQLRGHAGGTLTQPWFTAGQLDSVTSDTLHVCVFACLSPWVDLRQKETETKLFFPMLTRSCLRTFKMQCPPLNCFLNCTVSKPKHGSGVSITNLAVGKQLGCVRVCVCVVLISWCWRGGGAENHLST